MTSTSAHQKLSGLLMVIGSLVFVYGGAFHPRINSSLGSARQPRVLPNFFLTLAHCPTTVRGVIHGLILARAASVADGGRRVLERPQWVDSDGDDAMTLAARRGRDVRF